MQLVLQERNFLGLLLDDVAQLEELGGVLDLLSGVIGRVLVLARLQLEDLLTLRHRLLQLTRLVFQLAVLRFFFLNLVAQLLLGLVDGFDALGTAGLKLSYLVFKPFLVIFVLLHVLPLNDLLGLLGDTVELNVLGSLFVVSALKLQAFGPVLDMLEHSVGLEDRLHRRNLLLAATGDLVILFHHRALRHKDGVLVVSGHR